MSELCFMSLPRFRVMPAVTIASSIFLMVSSAALLMSIGMSPLIVSFVVSTELLCDAFSDFHISSFPGCTCFGVVPVPSVHG